MKSDLEKGADGPLTQTVRNNMMKSENMRQFQESEIINNAIGGLAKIQYLQPEEYFEAKAKFEAEANQPPAPPAQPVVVQ